MKFNIHLSYNLDLLNLMNPLTREEFYLKHHFAAVKEFFASSGEPLSKNSQHRIKKAVDIHGNAMLGPFLCLVISAVPNFQRRNLIRMFSDVDFLGRNFAQYSYFNSEKWSNQKSIFGLLLPVVRELEAKGFREYWRAKCLPIIRRSRNRLSNFVHSFQLRDEIESMLGPGQAPDNITLFLCTFASPHGIKLCGPRYIADVTFSKEATLKTAIHEMFHPPYEAKNLENELSKLEAEPLLKRAFEMKKPEYGYPTMRGFIEENVVEAMALLICQRIGLEKAPLAYLANHDEGSHVLSVILFEYFKCYPKRENQTFHDYFKKLFRYLPIGSLDVEYERIQRNGISKLR